MVTKDRLLLIPVWIIALSLAVIALKPLMIIKEAQAQSPLESLLGVGQKSGAQSTGQPESVSNEQLGGTAKSGRIVPFASQGGGVFWAYDKETLAIYVYDTKNGQSYFLGKLSQLGKPMDQAGVRAIPFLR